MHPSNAMMAIVKDLFSNIGGPTADFAKRFGGGSADLAKRFGGGSVDLAKYVGESATDIAKRVGTKRALIGLAVVGAAIGGIVLVRYLRARADEAADMDANEEPGTAAGRRNRKQTRAKRRAETAAAAVGSGSGITH